MLKQCCPNSQATGYIVPPIVPEHRHQVDLVLHANISVGPRHNPGTVSGFVPTQDIDLFPRMKEDNSTKNLYATVQNEKLFQLTRKD